MAARSRYSPDSLPLKVYLAVFILVILVGVAGLLTAISYMSTREELIRQTAELRVYSEKNVLESVILVDTGLKLYDNTLNGQMNEALGVYARAYEDAGGDIRLIDLPLLQKSLKPGFNGSLDLYIINESGVIVASTVPEVMGLDFRQFPDFYQSITRIRLGDSFAADRVVRSVPRAGEQGVTGSLRKFSYLPTADHRYLLEIGLISDSFFTERSDLSYHRIAERIQALNPNLVSVRVVDTNRVLVSDPPGGNVTLVNDPGIDYAIANRLSSTVENRSLGTTTSYLFADLADPSAASDMSVVIELVYTDALLNERLGQVIGLHLAIACLVIALGIVLAFGASQILTRPIREIVEDVDLIAQGDLDHPIRGMKNPEFVSLENSITTMIRRIRHYSEELEREKAELKVASDIQVSFLPRTIPQLPGFDIAAVSIPAKEVGGDFYDFIGLSTGRTGFVIADVAGKGVPAALFMVLSRTTVRSSVRMTSMVGEAVGDANRMIVADADQGMFVTLFFGVLDESARTLTYANAGHNPPLHYRAATREIEHLAATGMALGVDGDEIYRQEVCILSPGDLLVLYTDGVVEADNARGEQFGEARLRTIIDEAHALTATELIERIRQHLAEFTGDEPQFDDITLVVVKVI